MNKTTPSTATERFSSMAWRPERRSAQAALMASLNANPEFAARRDAALAANRGRMVARHKDRKFAAAHRERSRARMIALNSNPEFVAVSTQRLGRLQADPLFLARRMAKRRGLSIEGPQWVPRDLWTEFLDMAADFGEESPPPMCARSSGRRHHFLADVPKGSPSYESSASFSNPPSSSASKWRQKGLEFHQRRCER